MMRRKVLLILAVPALFMLSILFLMSDINNIPENRMLGERGEEWIWKGYGKDEEVFFLVGVPTD
jgi:hypothetical protein